MNNILLNNVEDFELPKFKFSSYIKKLNVLESSILCSLLYSDMFDHPLNANEILNFLLFIESNIDEVKSALDGEILSNLLSTRMGLYSLKGREYIFDIRKKKEELSKAKWNRAYDYIDFLEKLKPIKSAMVTGSLAANASILHDDIDFFFVVRSNSVWSVRRLAAIINALYDIKNLGEFCANYIVSEENLHIEDEDIFIAWELNKAIPVYGDEIYNKLLNQNKWIKQYFPNMRKRDIKEVKPKLSLKKLFIYTFIYGFNLFYSLGFGKIFEILEMKRKMQVFKREYKDATGVFNNKQMKIHAGYHRYKILNDYKYRLELFGLTKNKLYDSIIVKLDIIKRKMESSSLDK